MTRLVVAIWLLLASVFSAEAGVDQVFRPEEDGSTWRERAASRLGIDWVSESRSYALVVGISDYTGGYADLPTEGDATRVKDFLLKEAGFDHVHLLTEAEVTKERVDELMEEVFPDLVDANDRFLFYWSGHGDERRIGQDYTLGYLPVSGSAPDGWGTMIRMTALAGWDRVLRAHQALYLIDACFSGLAGTVSKSRTRELTIDQLSKPSRHLMTAGTGEEETIAGDRWNGSLFTDAVLDGLSGSADATSTFEADGVVSLAELEAYVKIRVADERARAGWNRTITPQVRDLRTNEGEFFFITPGAVDGRSVEDQEADATATTAKGVAAPSERLVLEAQEILAVLSFNPGPRDGILGLRTRGALLRFQKERGLEETAELNVATRNALANAWADQPRDLAPSVNVSDQESGGATTRPSELPDLAIFTDTLADGSACTFCPEMVVIPAGSFMMGSPPNEVGRFDNETPEHSVTLSRFAVGRHEVTFAEYQACVDAAGCAERPDDEGWGGGARPMINVAWNDAQSYVNWLSDATGEPYRLPSEAEWEYAARARTQTRYAFGEKITVSQANFGQNLGRTWEVGSGVANGWGLFDMHGNVWEWVEDCWHGNYDDAPRDGSARHRVNGGTCSLRVVRGGAWDTRPERLRSAYRNWYVRNNVYDYLGFRVAKTLTP